MGADDDRDCPGHIWELERLLTDHGRLAHECRCRACGTAMYGPPGSAMPPLVYWPGSAD